MRKLTVINFVLGAVLVASASLVAQQPPAGAPGGRQGGAPGGGQQAAPTNLKVLPKSWSGQQVRQVMQTFNESLGVQCTHCHAEDPNAPAPQPGQQPRLDYSLDTKKEKGVAREMLKQVMTINDTTKAIGDAAVTEKVSCWTCHRGEKQPAKAPAAGWGRGSFTLSTAGPAVPARGAGPGGPGAPAGGGRGQ